MNRETLIKNLIAEGWHHEECGMNVHGAQCDIFTKPGAEIMSGHVATPFLFSRKIADLFERRAENDYLIFSNKKTEETHAKSAE